MTDKPAIVPVIEAAGVTLHRRGRHLVGLCPLHADRTPSFVVDPERQRFKCFGCGAGGDVIDLIQQLYGIDFQEACRILSIRRERPDPEARRRREAVQDFRAWCRERHSELVTLANTYRWIIKGIKTDADVELVAGAGLFDELPVLEHEAEILFSGTDEEKFSLWRGEKDCR